MNKTKQSLFATLGVISVALLVFTGWSLRGPASGKNEKPESAAVRQAAVDSVWTEDIDAAFKTAAEAGKPVFIDFTGSDWCYWCKLAEKNIFSTPEWKAFAADVVCLKVDFPQKNRPDVFTMEKRLKLSSDFGVRGYPTLVLATAERKEIARFSAGRKGAAEFIAEVRKKLPASR